jgi:arylsulfatase A-like enzyme
MVVFVMIDGLRPDAVAAAQCPHLKGLIARGAATLSARSSFPPVTLPCHTSIFHSVPSTRHGIVSNDWLPMSRPLPGLFELVKAAGLRSAAFYNWEQLRDVSRPGSLSYSYYCDTALDPEGDMVTVEQAIRALATGHYDFAFVYLGNVDIAGHAQGWMSEGYLAQAERADRALGALLAALPADGAVLVQADHGGHDFMHGEDILEDMTIPWIVAGPGVRRGYTIRGAVSLLDTAPTLARLLGIAPHAEWEGRCIEEIFDPGT